MKKRVLSLLMSLVLLVGLLPAAAQAADEPVGSVLFSVETKTIDGGYLIGPTEVYRYADDTVYSILSRTAAERGLSVSGAESGYVTRIGDFGSYTDSEYGLESGWMVALNNDHNTWPLPALRDGDSIRFCYTYKTYGYDIDLIDRVDALRASMRRAEDKLSETNPFGEADGYLDDDASKFNRLSVIYTEGNTILSEIDAYGSNQAYLDALTSSTAPCPLYGAGSETEYVESLLRRLECALNGEAYIAATGAELSVAGSPVSFYTGRTYRFSAAIMPANATVQDGTWAVVSAGGEASITPDGRLTPTKAGMVIVQYWHPDAPNGTLATKLVRIEDAPAQVKLPRLLPGIASAYTDTTTHWNVMDMGAYAVYEPDGAALSDAARQSYINRAIAQLASGQGDYGPLGDTDCDKIILALASLGADPTQLYPVNSNTPLNAFTLLEGTSHSTSAWSAPYTLFAYQTLGHPNDEAARTLLRALLDSQCPDGSWNEYGTIDTTANVLAGLSCYQDETEVRAAMDRAIAYLSSQQKASGAFDDGQADSPYAAGENANSTAMVLIGLAAAGIDPNTDERFIKNGVSALDGLLGFALDDNSGFGYTDNTTRNASATEQGFRALIAAAQVAKTGCAYNVYDFSGSSLSPVRATGSGSVETPDEPTGTQITVSVTIKSDTEYWLKSRSVTLSGEGATVYHAFVKALEGSGLTQTGAASGYVSAIAKDGVSLGQFDKGPNSGWLYKVNGTLPSVGLTDCAIHDGDEIVWYYTEDWTRDPSAGSMGGAKPAEPVTPPDAVQSFADVADTAWYADAVRYVFESGLMTGVSDHTFDPDGTATRAQLVTILWRLAGSPVVNYAMRYSDVTDAAWYAEAVRWAASTGIAGGYADGSFGPNDALTREQLAVLLYRCAQMRGQGFTGAWYFPLRFTDAASVSEWADEAMHWCVMHGLLNGTDDNRLAPCDAATRAQLAAILQRFCGQLPTAEASSVSEAAYVRASAYLTTAVPAPQSGSMGGEWTVLALLRGGADANTSCFTGYLTALEQTLRANAGVLSTRRNTEYSRVILALSALGRDARDVAGYDLTLPLGDYEKTVAQGVNGAIYALLALDSRGYSVPQNAEAAVQATRQMYVDAILSAQRADGSWSFTDGGNADPDLTAMALQALANYTDERGVSDAIDRALTCLSALQLADGGFASWGTENAESCAQVILALGELGLAPNDARFVKNGQSVLDALLTYQTADGSFCHERGGEVNLMATEQAACALASLVRAERGETSFYQMASSAERAAA